MDSKNKRGGGGGGGDEKPIMGVRSQVKESCQTEKEDWLEKVLNMRTPISPTLTLGFFFAPVELSNQTFFGRKNIGVLRLFPLRPPPPFQVTPVDRPLKCWIGAEKGLRRYHLGRRH